MRDNTTKTNHGIDVIWSAAEIAKAIGRGERATYRLLEQGALPAKRVGRQWVASVDALKRALRVEQQAS